MLTMEEKERFMKTIEDVNNDEVVMKEWMLEENARLKYEGEMSYAKEEGADYNFISKVTGKTIDEIKENIK